MMSEWTIGHFSDAKMQGRGWVLGGANRMDVVFIAPAMLQPVQLESFVNACSKLGSRDDKVASVTRGFGWMEGSLLSALYNHTEPPASLSCLNGDNITEGAITAGSRHDDIINALFADGHVSPVATKISARIWQALGTRAGSEAISQSDVP
jgi:prepilin-type processing-associated H-X9-DG protein